MSRFRVAVAVVASSLGWLLSFTYPIHLIGAYTHTCTMGNDGPHLTSLLLGPATLLLAMLLIWAGRQQARYLRWFIIPHVVTIGVAIWLLPRYLLLCTLSGRFICAASLFGDSWEGTPAALWHFFYAPGHLVVLAVFFWSAIQFWRWPNPGWGSKWLLDLPARFRTRMFPQGRARF